MARRLKVLFVSKKTAQALELRDSLATNPDYEILFEETAEGTMSVITHRTMDCVIFHFEHFGESQVRLVQGIKQVANVFQILIFADEAEEIAVELVKSAKNLIVIEKPLLNLEKDISGLCKRLIGGEEVFQRESKRFTVIQNAHIEILGTDKTFEGKIVDISKNGARLELTSGTLTKNDQLKVTIELEKLGHNRVVTCEIKWVRSTADLTIAGVRFLKSHTHEE